jgi:hypothetical protein
MYKNAYTFIGGQAEQAGLHAIDSYVWWNEEEIATIRIMMIIVLIHWKTMHCFNILFFVRIELKKNGSNQEIIKVLLNLGMRHN